jgi:hypothetical protein
VDGKEKYFDPGSRYCPYGQMEWKHSDTYGLRQTDGGTALQGTPGQPLSASGVNRVANIKMDETGKTTGIVDLKFIGMPALKWRHQFLTGDRDSLEREMKESVERMLPGGMEVKVLSIDKLDDYEEPLTAKLVIKGAIGSATGKRLIIPNDLFETNEKAPFVHEKRELPVAMSFRYTAHDAIRINFPPTFQIETVPPAGDFTLPKLAVYKSATSPDATSVTTRRDLYMGEVLFKKEEYPDLRNFYSQFEAKDQEPIVLKVAATSPGN